MKSKIMDFFRSLLSCGCGKRDIDLVIQVSHKSIATPDPTINSEMYENVNDNIIQSKDIKIKCQMNRIIASNDGSKVIPDKNFSHFCDTLKDLNIHNHDIAVGHSTTKELLGEEMAQHDPQ